MGSITEGAGNLAASIREKIKLNAEKRKSDELFDAVHAKLTEDAIKSGKGEDDLKALEKKIQGMKKVGFSVQEAIQAGKVMAPDLFSSKAPQNVYVQGNNGAPRLTGQVPGGSKVFKELQTPEMAAAKVSATEEAKYQAVKDTAARAFDLRKEFQAIPEVKDYQLIKGQVSAMDALLNNVKTGDGESALALDQGLITLFNKITDPRSVVRESEYERTPQNLSLANRFGGAFEKLKQGGAGLTAPDREALVFGAKVIADSRAEIYNQTFSNYENLSKEFGVKPELVTSGFGKAEKFTAMNGSGDSNFQTFKVDGKTYNIPKDKVAAFKKAKGIK